MKWCARFSKTRSIFGDMNIVIIDGEWRIARRQLEDIHVVAVTNGQSYSGFVGREHLVVGHSVKK